MQEVSLKPRGWGSTGAQLQPAMALNRAPSPLELGVRPGLQEQAGGRAGGAAAAVRGHEHTQPPAARGVPSAHPAVSKADSKQL